MKCEIKFYEDRWQEIKDAAMVTISRDAGKYPNSGWKKRILRAEHSPIRLGEFIFKFTDIPTFVATHFVRHHVGVTPFVSTRRDDRFDGEVPDRNSPVDMLWHLNFQAMIAISRKRLCFGSHETTIEAWKMLLDCAKEKEPELVECCVKECVYRGHCPEYISCGYCKSEEYKNELDAYR